MIASLKFNQRRNSISTKYCIIQLIQINQYNQTLIEQREKRGREKIIEN